MSEHSTAPTDLPAVTVTRNGHRNFTGRSARGGQVAIGDAAQPGTFTPGELLKVALAACAGFSAESAVVRRLGDDAAMTVAVTGNKHPDDRYDHLDETITIDLSGLDDAARERLVTIIDRSVEQACTVGRTLKAGASIDLHVTDAD